MIDTDLSRFKILVVDDEPTVIDELKKFIDLDALISIQNVTTAKTAIELITCSVHEFFSALG